METVEYQQTGSASFGSGHPGPAPPATARSAPRTMTAAQSAVLDVLARESKPVGVLRLSKLTGLHPNTVREHLDALVAGEFVHRQTADLHRRGRPSWLYSVDETSVNDQSTDLALALAGELARQALDPVEAAIRAGQRWAEGYVRSSGSGVHDDVEAIVERLKQLGFDPSTATDDSNELARIRLHRCPMLTAARAHPEIVCNVHLGLVQGLLGASESPTDDSDVADSAVPELRAFAESDFCLLTLKQAQS